MSCSPPLYDLGLDGTSSIGFDFAWWGCPLSYSTIWNMTHFLSSPILCWYAFWKLNSLLVVGSRELGWKTTLVLCAMDINHSGQTTLVLCVLSLSLTSALSLYILFSSSCIHILWKPFLIICLASAINFKILKYTFEISMWFLITSIPSMN